MTCKRALIFGAIGGLLVGALSYCIMVALNPDSLCYRGLEVIYFPLTPLHAWLQRAFDQTKVDIELIYFIAFPCYWALLGLLASFGCWSLFKRKQT
jgi:hypothetical protein